MKIVMLLFALLLGLIFACKNAFDESEDVAKKLIAEQAASPTPNTTNQAQTIAAL